MHNPNLPNIWTVLLPTVSRAERCQNTLRLVTTWTSHIMTGHTPWHVWIYAVTAYVTELKRFSMRWLYNNHQGFSQTMTTVHLGVLSKIKKAANCCLKMDPAMDISKTWVRLKGVAKIFEAGLQSKTWDIHGMPHFVTTTHCEGCNTCEAYMLHIVEVSRVPTVEILPDIFYQWYS